MLLLGEANESLLSMAMFWLLDLIVDAIDACVNFGLWVAGDDGTSCRFWVCEEAWWRIIWGCCFIGCCWLLIVFFDCLVFLLASTTSAWWKVLWESGFSNFESVDVTLFLFAASSSAGLCGSSTAKEDVDISLSLLAVLIIDSVVLIGCATPTLSGFDAFNELDVFVSSSWIGMGSPETNVKLAFPVPAGFDALIG